MSTALYRRYRPETFAEVIGQEHVTEPLITALTNNRVNHAYLFSGPRGCGTLPQLRPRTNPYPLRRMRLLPRALPRRRRLP